MAGQKTQFPEPIAPSFAEVSVTNHTTSRTAFFLTRLSKLLHLLDEWKPRVTASDWHLRLIHKAIYSTYCDCKAAGIQDDAQRLVDQYQRARHEQIERVN